MILSTLIFFAIVTIIAPLLGKYIAWVFFDKNLNNLISHSKNGLIKQQTWKRYFISMMTFNVVCIFTTFLIIFFQKYLPTGSELIKELDLAATINDQFLLLLVHFGKAITLKNN